MLRPGELIMKCLWIFQWKCTMAVTMDSELVSLLMNLFDNIWMRFDVLSNQKEGGADLMFCQHIQHLRRIAWMGSIWTATARDME